LCFFHYKPRRRDDGTSGYRYQAASNARKADVQITAARLASLLLNSWKGLGGYSGYSVYELLDPGDYDPGDPNDYDPGDMDDIELNPTLEITADAPGPDIPDGFNALDSIANPNYKIVVNGVNYYVAMSYKDEDDTPRLLNLCVGWMADYQAWDDSKPYRSVVLSTYAND